MRDEEVHPRVQVQRNAPLALPGGIVGRDPIHQNRSGTFAIGLAAEANIGPCDRRVPLIDLKIGAHLKLFGNQRENILNLVGIIGLHSRHLFHPDPVTQDAIQKRVHVFWRKEPLRQLTQRLEVEGRKGVVGHEAFDCGQRVHSPEPVLIDIARHARAHNRIQVIRDQPETAVKLPAIHGAVIPMAGGEGGLLIRNQRIEGKKAHPLLHVDDLPHAAFVLLCRRIVEHVHQLDQVRPVVLQCIVLLYVGVGIALPIGALP